MESYQTIPILLSGSLGDTINFYGNLGFEICDDFAANGYLIIRLEGIEIHFQHDAGNIPASNNSMCYIRTIHADELFNKWNGLNLPKHGIPRMDNIELKPWGMKEFAIIDPSGNLIRIGYPINKASN